jgi:hypothetical protein
MMSGRRLTVTSREAAHFTVSSVDLGVTGLELAGETALLQAPKDPAR